MESPNRQYISQVDELRALAALLVLFFHCRLIGYWLGGHHGWIFTGNPIEALLLEGHSGVALFMVLSGYILARGTWGRPVAYRDFLLNRIIRIFPLMTVVVVAAAYAKTSVTAGEIFAPFMLLQNIPSLSLSETSGIVGTVWTISIEFQFYLVAPFLFLFVERYGFKGYVLPFVTFIVCLRTFILIQHREDTNLLWQYPYFSIIGRINQFVIGIYLARRWDELSKASTRYGGTFGLMLLLAGLLGMVVLSYAENRGGGQYAWHWWRLPQQEIEGVFYAALIAGYILLDPLAIVPCAKTALRSIGIISFSVYILHWPIMTGVFGAITARGLPFPGRPTGVLSVAAGVILPLVLAMSALSYACIERPFLQLRRRYVSMPAEDLRPASAVGRESRKNEAAAEEVAARCGSSNTEPSGEKMAPLNGGVDR